MLAAMCLGADGVQVGSRFAATKESSAHDAFKQKITETGEGGTVLALKELTPVRLIKNKFYEEVTHAEARCASKEELQQLLGRGRAKRGMFEGNLDDGELEIGQVSALINDVPTAAEIVQRLIAECNAALQRASRLGSL